VSRFGVKRLEMKCICLLYTVPSTHLSSFICEAYNELSFSSNTRNHFHIRQLFNYFPMTLNRIHKPIPTCLPRFRHAKARRVWYQYSEIQELEDSLQLSAFKWIPFQAVCLAHFFPCLLVFWLLCPLHECVLKSDCRWVAKSARVSG
jgi:hypothetical protein